MIKLSLPVVINTCFGGYGLSRDAALELMRRKGLKPRSEENFMFVGDTFQTVEDVVPRNDPDLIDIVRTMGDKANGDCACLKIVNVAVEIDFPDFDGKERVEVSGIAR